MKWILFAEFLLVNGWSRKYAPAINQFRRPQKLFLCSKSSSNQITTPTITSASSKTKLEANLTNKVAIYCPLLAAELQMPAAVGNIADEDGLLLRRNLEVYR